MSVNVSIDSAFVPVAPGGEVTRVLRVQNTGMVVDHILLDVLGESQRWATIEPAQMNLLPGEDGYARLTFRPPRAATPRAGQVPYAVRVMSQEDPAGSSIEEGVVEVEPFVEVKADLIPRTAQARRRARFRLVVENNGNAATNAAVSVMDPDLLLEYRLKPQAFVAEPGTATFVRLDAIPKKRFIKGPNKSLPFQTLLQGDGFAPVTNDGTVLQEQLMPAWLLPALAALLAIAAVLAVLWFTVVKPEVHSAATAAAAQAVAPLKSSAAQASQAAQSASQSANSASTSANQAKKAQQTVSSQTKSSGNGTTTVSGPPTSGMLQSNAAPVTTTKFQTKTFAVPAKHTLYVSDLVLQNPLGDSGILQVRAGSTVLFNFGPANFRSVDYHFVQALTFTKAHPLVLAVECKNTTKTNCTAGLSFSGVMHKS